MTLKNWMLAGLAVALATVYVIYFTDWFRPKTMQIFHTVRVLPARGAARGKPTAPVPQLLFGLNRQFALTEITVVPLAELATNPHPLAVWHVVSDSNSVPVKTFVYGQNIRGLKPSVAGLRPRPLETNVTYRMLVEAGAVKGQHDFELK
jgi:hypothetical protein